MRNRRMTNAYRHEIAALTGKPWREVDVQDMERLANGNHSEHLPPVEVFDEQLERERGKRYLYIIGHVAAAVVAGIAVWAGFTHFNETFMEWGTPIKDALMHTLPSSMGSWIGTNMKPEVIPAMLSAGTITLAADTLFNVAGERVLGLKDPTVYERVQDIKRELRNGKTISVEQVFDLVLEANPTFRDSIQARYGKPFEKLPAATRQELMSTFNSAYPISQITADVNDGKRSGNELAFFVYGQESGVKPGEPVKEKDAAQPAKEKAKTIEIATEVPSVSMLAEMLHIKSEPGRAVTASQHQGFLAQHMAVGKNI